MFVYQEFEKSVTDVEKEKFIANAVENYVKSQEYKNIKIAESYFYSENIAILERENFKVKTLDHTFTINRQVAASNFFFRLVTQQNQFLLSNGLQIDNDQDKIKLGFGFDTTLQEAGEWALIHGISWLFFNNDHVELIKSTNFIPLWDEFTGEALAGINFWQLSADSPIYARLFEIDGITWYKISYKTALGKNNRNIELYKPKQKYKSIVQHNVTIGETNYKTLPVVPLRANERSTTELKASIKTKIDMYDLVLSDFSDNLQKANSIYWVLENFDGDINEAEELRAQIEHYKMVFTRDEETTAKGEFMQVPFEARAVILDLLESGIYRDFMGLNMKEITGGSLTNVAIDTAKFNLVNKVNRYEYRVFECVQRLLELANIKTNSIRFRREFVANKLETMQMLYMCRADIDLTTALEKNPLVEIDEVEIILQRLQDEEVYNGGNQLMEMERVPQNE